MDINGHVTISWDVIGVIISHDFPMISSSGTNKMKILVILVRRGRKGP
jgi:hypothetical protein